MLRDTIAPNQRFKQDSNGILLIFDRSRTSWISVARENLTFGLNHRNISNDRWMILTGGSFSNSTGYKLPRNAVITALTIQSQNNTTCDFKIKKNGNIDVTSISLLNENSKVIDNLKININKNDYLQSLLEISSGVIDYPELLIEFAWRE